ncbi:MAG: type II secretion system protein [Sulfuriferula sp.]
MSLATTVVRSRGFTLIELVITVAIVGLLASVVLPMAELTVQRSKEQELRLALRQIRNALDAYKQAVDEGRVTQSVGQSGYPPTLKVLVDGVADASSPDKKSRIYFLRRIPRNPMYLDSSRADEETWGLRSYASSYDAPEQGDDVFDVYSLSPGVGLNGIRYRNW